MTVTQAKSTGAALSGIKVLDLSRVLAGPWCSMTLGDLGAEIIKVEHPERGDDTRGWGQKYQGGEGTYFVSCNRNKKGIAVDMSDKAGSALIKELALRSDILIENYKLDGLKKYGLDYQTLSALNPRLIYCSISGYGRTGPSAARLGYDFLIQGESGLMSITGEPEGAPMKVGVPISDLLAGASAAQAVLAALYARTVTGRGQLVDISLHDCTLANLCTVANTSLMSNRAPQRFGNAHPDIVPYETFPAKDGDLILAIGNDAQFTRLCTIALNLPLLPNDPRFVNNRQRLENRHELRRILSPQFLARTRLEWSELFEKAGIAAGVVRTMLEAVESIESTGRDMVKTVAHPTAGSIKMLGSPLKLSDTPVVEPTAPPLLGQHTVEILSEMLGMSKDQIDSLRQMEIIK